MLDVNGGGGHVKALLLEIIIRPNYSGNMAFFSHDVVFFDTEFSSLNPYKGEILSLGMVKPDGSELYLELEYEGDYDPWVRQHLLHTLTAAKVSRAKAAEQVQAFVGPGKPRAVAYVNQFDTLYLHKLLGGVEGSPFYWIPVDFAAMLFALGYDPEHYYRQDSTFFQKLGVDPANFTQHNALDDARLLQATYLALAEH
jgi:DNA polymerase III epsilon subunit-like protein